MYTNKIKPKSHKNNFKQQNEPQCLGPAKGDSREGGPLNCPPQRSNLKLVSSEAKSRQLVLVLFPAHKVQAMAANNELLESTGPISPLNEIKLKETKNNILVRIIT